MPTYHRYFQLNFTLSQSSEQEPRIQELVLFLLETQIVGPFLITISQNLK